MEVNFMKKFCSFYVSEYHLLTILLPYINEKISDSQDVELILQEDMLECVKKYLKRNEMLSVSKIIKLGWKKVKKDFDGIRENVDIVIIIGNEEFIKNANGKIEKKSSIKEMVGCYNIESLDSLNDIVKEHDFVLKTSGLCEIIKSSHNEQKRKTIQTQI